MFTDSLEKQCMIKQEFQQMILKSGKKTGKQKFWISRITALKIIKGSKSRSDYE